MQIRSGAEDGTIDNTTRSEGVTACAKAHKIVFGEHRPVRGEHPFGTGANGPAGTVVGQLADLPAIDIEKGYLRIGPRRATLHIKQNVRCHEIAAASRQGIKPVCTGVSESSAAAQACAVKHIAKAKDPRVPLVITANLTATGKATIARRDSSTCGNISNLEI